MAMISDADEMSKPASRIGPFALPPSPEAMWRNPRSSASVTLRHVMPSAPRPGIVPL